MRNLIVLIAVCVYYTVYAQVPADLRLLVDRLPAPSYVDDSDNESEDSKSYATSNVVGGKV